MPKRHLPQIKTFEIGIYYRDGSDTNQAVNEFIIEVFERTGNVPVIHPCGNHILVVWDELVEVNQPPVPARAFERINTSGIPNDCNNKMQ